MLVKLNGNWTGYTKITYNRKEGNQMKKKIILTGGGTGVVLTKYESFDMFNIAKNTRPVFARVHGGFYIFPRRVNEC